MANSFEKFTSFIDWLLDVGILWQINFAVYLMPNPLLYKNQFYLKQFSLARIHSLIIKTFLFQAIQLSQAVLIPTIHFKIKLVSISKTVQF